MKRFALAVGAVAVLAAVVVPSAPAGVKYPTSVAITSIQKPAGSPMEFRGSVSSPKQKCRSNRKVVVFQDVAGPSIRIGSDVTTGGGHWRLSVDLNPANGDVYYASAPRKRIGAGKACKAGRSSDYTFNF
jgi:hypothetical protein